MALTRNFKDPALYQSLRPFTNPPPKAKQIVGHLPGELSFQITQETLIIPHSISLEPLRGAPSRKVGSRGSVCFPPRPRGLCRGDSSNHTVACPRGYCGRGALGAPVPKCLGGSDSVEPEAQFRPTWLEQRMVSLGPQGEGTWLERK